MVEDVVPPWTSDLPEHDPDHSPTLSRQVLALLSCLSLLGFSPVYLVFALEGVPLGRVLDIHLK